MYASVDDSDAVVRLAGGGFLELGIGLVDVEDELKGGLCLSARRFLLVCRFNGDDGEFAEYAICAENVSRAVLINK